MKKQKKIIIYIAIAFLGIMWVSYSLSKKNTNAYVYIDTLKILHSTNKCRSIASVNGATPVKIYSMNELKIDLWDFICSKCIDEKVYEQMMKCRKVDVKHMPDKIDILYNALKADGAISKSREYFRSKMLAPGAEGYRNRKHLYDALKADGAVSSKNYEEFAARLGLHAPTSATTAKP